MNAYHTLSVRRILAVVVLSLSLLLSGCGCKSDTCGAEKSNDPVNKSLVCTMNPSAPGCK